MIIYKTTNILNGKFYIGKDKYNDPKYLGSGIYLIQAIKKYGKNNFIKEILCECDTNDEANIQERYWIRKLNSQNRDIGYNISEGGDGGDTITKNPNRDAWLEKKRGKIPWNKGKKTPRESIDKMIESKKKFFEMHPEKKINSGSFKPGESHVLYGKKRDENIVNKIVSTRMKNDGYKSNNPTNAQIAARHEVIAENIITGEKVEYKSVADICLQMNIPRVSMTCMLRHRYKTNKKRKYLDYKFYYKDKDYNEGKKFRKQ